MKLNNIFAVVCNDFLVIRRVKYRLLELLYFPLSSVLIWGLFALYSRKLAVEAGLIVLVINVFWSFAHLAQQQANILMMEDVWSSSFRQVLVSGVSELEYTIAKLIVSSTAAIPITGLLIIVANAFGAPFFANFKIVLMMAGIGLLGSLALAVFVTGLIMAFGREYGFLSWSLLQLFIFFSAPFYPPAIFPAAIRWITYLMPFTRLFEAGRAIATNTPVSREIIMSAFIVAAAYFILAWPFLLWAFKYARKTGVLARIAG